MRERKTGQKTSEKCRNRRTKFTDRPRIDEMHRERPQETDTQIEPWRQTLRDRVETAKRQEGQRAPSPPVHTAEAVPLGRERAVGVIKGGAWWGVLMGRGLEGCKGGV